MGVEIECWERKVHKHHISNVYSRKYRKCLKLGKESTQEIMISILSKEMDVNSRENSFGAESDCSKEWKPAVEETGMLGLVTDFFLKNILRNNWFSTRRNISALFFWGTVYVYYYISFICIT